MADAFYVPLGDGRFSATAHTAGPWSSDAQHFGPPSALLVRALENVETAHPAELARVTVEILGPAPVAELTVRAWIERPGRSVELLRFERTLEAIWQAILKAGKTGDFRANKSKLCNWCDHQAHCPEYGGTPPAYPGWPEPDAGDETPLDRAD